MRSPVLIAALLAVLGFTTFCLAHGITHEILEVGAGVKATYSDESPMAYCDVAIFAPGGPESEFQTGTTDPNGCFAFVPDTTGVWRVTVDDGMGHLLTAEVSVGPEGVEATGAARGYDRVRSVVVGISVIFGLFGVLALLRSRRRPGSGVNANAPAPGTEP